jgi:hypothetical protein
MPTRVATIYGAPLCRRRESYSPAAGLSSEWETLDRVAIGCGTSVKIFRRLEPALCRDTCVE